MHAACKWSAAQRVLHLHFVFPQFLVIDLVTAGKRSSCTGTLHRKLPKLNSCVHYSRHMQICEYLQNKVQGQLRNLLIVCHECRNQPCLQPAFRYNANCNGHNVRFHRNATTVPLFLLAVIIISAVLIQASFYTCTCYSTPDIFLFDSWQSDSLLYFSPLLAIQLRFTRCPCTAKRQAWSFHGRHYTPYDAHLLNISQTASAATIGMK